ncbi:MAG TPA: hypothetical protein PLZ99_01275 [Parcubacteria group bacterium]|jgi:type II secretory pathway pseudopilin PulG|nr:hypothetical protein [Parcubacteria group bacterium]
MSRTNKTKGITLIETIIYIGLLGIIIYGGIFTTFHMVEIGNKNSNYSKILNEAIFINNKINWILTNSTSIEVLNNSLIVNKEGLNENNPLVLKQNSKNITLKRGQNEDNILNNERYIISDVIIDHNPTQKFITIKYKINNQNFSYKKYLN